MKILTSSPKTPYFLTGNRCGHNPDLLRDIIFKAEENRPIILKDSIKLIRKKFFSRHKKTKLIFGLRSEAMEAIGQLLLKFVYNYELATQQVCINDITYKRERLSDIVFDCLKTGLSYSRAKKAQSWLIKAGFLQVIRCPDYEKYKKGEWASDPSIRRLTPKFFAFLSHNIASRLGTQIHYKQKRLEKRKIKLYQTRESDRRLKSITRSIEINSYNQASARIRGTKKKSAFMTKEEVNRLKNEYLRLLKEKAPNINDDKLRYMIDQKPIEQIKSMIDQHRFKKFTDPP
jgi:hypothetical protein